MSAFFFGAGTGTGAASAIMIVLLFNSITVLQMKEIKRHLTKSFTSMLIQ
jgi:hypothetical protein